MRRKYFGLAIAAAALLGPQSAFAGDREIAGQIINRLKANRAAGQLNDIKFDMNVKDGVVLFRGSVSADRQRDLVLAAADGIDGIEQVIDKIQVGGGETTTESIGPVAGVAIAGPVASQPVSQPVSQPASSSFDMAGALATAAAEIMAESSMAAGGQTAADSMVQPVAAYEDNAEASDRQVVDSVLSALGAAQQSGQLRGFGVDVQCHGGEVQLNGKATSESQREQIMSIVRRTAGVSRIRENIQIVGTNQPRSPLGQPAPMSDPPAAQTASQAAPQPTNRVVARPAMQPAMQPVARPLRTLPAAARMPQQPVAQTTPYRMPSGGMNQGAMRAMPAAHVGGMMGAPVGGVTGTPVPMAPYAAPGAPRYDTPNLPNYAWPGYAAHPNYAAVTYPQQYSPSAWPYIGPFYPYPQVPLGWRKVSLEWDDGWWFLDFTDRDY